MTGLDVEDSQESLVSDHGVPSLAKNEQHKWLSVCRVLSKGMNFLGSLWVPVSDQEKVTISATLPSAFTS